MGKPAAIRAVGLIARRYDAKSR